jgi:hypothetical protein
MAISALLPFFDGNFHEITKGDILEMIDGGKYTFLEMKQKNFIGKSHKDGSSGRKGEEWIMGTSLLDFNDHINKVFVKINK